MAVKVGYNKNMQVYVPPTLTVDAVVFQLKDKQLQVLLIQRAAEPFKGEWALPGGYSPEGETTVDALTRIVRAKAGVDLAQDIKLLEQLYTFDAVARDPRGHSVAVSYLGLGTDVQSRGEDLQQPNFYPVTNLPRLAYDHEAIIRYAHQRLQSKLSYTNIIFALLPRTFTFSQLQQAYEAVLCRELDKRNFRKRIQNLELVKETGALSKGGAHRPAKLFEFKHKSLITNFEILK